MSTRRASISFFVFSTLIPAVWAQEAALSGTVRDSTGGVLPQATVRLTSQERGAVQTVPTNQAGVYQFSFLTPGGYNLEISASGFKTLTRPNIALAVAQNARMDFTLELGNVSENVTVEAEAGALNTESAEMGAVVDNTRVTEMPLNGRTFFSLAPLAPGVLPPAQNSSLGYRGGFNVAGSCEGCNNFSLNGFDNNDPAVAIPNFRPSIDAIQEFNLLTGVYPAQYGYGSGGQVIVITKSGSNSLHGAAYDFLRNQAIMSARNFFALPGAIPSFKRNQFGGVLGGPIRKNQTFFFYSYEGLRLTQAVIGLATVPTLAMDSGDFSGITKVIKDPKTGSPTNPSTWAPFDRNMIPRERFNAVGLALLSYYPPPNVVTPAGATPSNNYDFNGIRPEHYNADSLKLDHIFSPRDSAFATANYYRDQSLEHNTASTCNSTVLPAFSCKLVIKNQVYGLSETHIFSPSMVNEARMGFSITDTPSVATNASNPFWVPFGVRPLLTHFVKLPDQGIPTMSATGFTSFSSSRAFLRADPRWQFTDTFSWTRGKHTIRIGANLSHYATNNLNLGSQGGTAAFTNTSQGPTTSYSVADLLLGLPSSTAASPYQYQLYIRESNISAFIQDDYKISSRLTLNLGLRWEMNTPPLDYAHRETGFDPAKGIPITEGSDGFGEHIFRFDWHGYAPRLGFAWQPFSDGKTVIRGGAGTFFNNISLFNGVSGIYAGVPYAVNDAFTSSLTQPISLSNPFPSANAVITNSPAGADAVFRNPRTYQWSFGVQRQLATDLLLDVSYFGSSGSHLQETHNINQPLPGPGTPAQVNARRPYPQYGTLNFYEWDGNAHYQSMQVKLQKRYAYGLSFLGAYTYGKSIDDLGSFTSQRDFTTSRGLSSFDIRHRVVFSPVYELPFGKGKPYLGQGVAGRILGGWQLSSLFQWNTGTPLTATLSGNFSNSGGTTDRPDLIGDPNANAPHTPQQWFNTSAFALRPANGQAGATYSFGNEGKGVIEGPGLFSMDLSLVRNFTFRERVRLQFRAEMFNATNHTNFGFPGLIMDGSGFGAITNAQDPRESQLALKLVF